MQLQEKTTAYEVLAKLWEMVGMGIFMVNNEDMLCFVNYCSKFPVIKKKDGLSAKDLI